MIPLLFLFVPGSGAGAESLGPAETTAPARVPGDRRSFVKAD